MLRSFGATYPHGVSPRLLRQWSQRVAPQRVTHGGIRPLQRCPAGRWQGCSTYVEKGGAAPSKQAAYAIAICCSLSLPFVTVLHLIPILITRPPNREARAMSITIDKILAAAPVTIRGQSTQLSCDAKGERIAYAVGPTIYLLSLQAYEHLDGSGS